MEIRLVYDFDDLTNKIGEDNIVWHTQHSDDGSQAQVAYYRGLAMGKKQSDGFYDKEGNYYGDMFFENKNANMEQRRLLDKLRVKYVRGV